MTNMVAHLKRATGPVTAITSAVHMMWLTITYMSVILCYKLQDKTEGLPCSALKHPWYFNPSNQ